MRRVFIMGFVAVLLFAGQAAAQSGTAIEVAPGVTFYSGQGGGTLGVETMPGVQYFSGEVSGSAIEIMPGVTRYNFNSLDSFADELAAQSERDFAAGRALDREYETKKRLDRIERYQRATPDERRWMDILGR